MSSSYEMLFFTQLHSIPFYNSYPFIRVLTVCTIVLNCAMHWWFFIFSIIVQHGTHKSDLFEYFSRPRFLYESSTLMGIRALYIRVQSFELRLILHLLEHSSFRTTVPMWGQETTLSNHCPCVGTDKK